MPGHRPRSKRAWAGLLWCNGMKWPRHGLQLAPAACRGACAAPHRWLLRIWSAVRKLHTNESTACRVAYSKGGMDGIIAAAQAHMSAPARAGTGVRNQARSQATRCTDHSRGQKWSPQSGLRVGCQAGRCTQAESAVQAHCRKGRTDVQDVEDALRVAAAHVVHQVVARADSGQAEGGSAKEACRGTLSKLQPVPWRLLKLPRVLEASRCRAGQGQRAGERRGTASACNT